MRRTFRLLLVLIFIAAGIVILAGAHFGDSQNAPVPFRASFQNLTSAPAPNSGDCPSDTVLVNASGSGQTTLGDATITEAVCMNPTNLLFVARFTISTSAGRVVGTASGFGVPEENGTFTIHGNWFFEDGTGRFHQLSGKGAAIGNVNLATGASPHELLGTISGFEPK